MRKIPTCKQNHSIDTIQNRVTERLAWDKISNQSNHVSKITQVFFLESKMERRHWVREWVQLYHMRQAYNKSMTHGFRRIKPLTW